MRSLGILFDFGSLSNDEYIAIEEIVANKLQMSGFDEAYNITSDGVMCESILDQLANE